MWKFGDFFKQKSASGRTLNFKYVPFLVHRVVERDETSKKN